MLRRVPRRPPDTPEELYLDLLKRWIGESYRAVAPKKLAALVPAED